MNTDYLDTLLGNIATEILDPLLLLLVVIAFLVFIWGVIEFIANADNSDARQTGRRHIIWGIVGLFIMFGVLGIMSFIKNTLGV